MNKDERKRYFRTISCEVNLSRWNELEKLSKQTKLPKSVIIRDSLDFYINYLNNL